MEPPQVTQYVPVLMLLLLAIVFVAGMQVGSVLLGKRGRRTRQKDIPYECGNVPVGEGAPRMSVKFYLVAMLFILFDIEVIFLYPLAVVYKEMLADSATRNTIFFGTVVFLGILLVGLLYEVKKKALNWRE